MQKEYMMKNIEENIALYTDMQSHSHNCVICDVREAVSIIFHARY